MRRADLVLLGVGGAHEARGVLGVGDQDGVAIDAVPLQPAAVVDEVLPHRADQDGPHPQVGHAEGDIGRDPAPPDLEVVREEGQGDLVQLLDDQGVGEPAIESHQVVTGDGAGHEDLHGRHYDRLPAGAHHSPRPAPRVPDRAWR